MCSTVFAFGGAIDDIPSLRRLNTTLLPTTSRCQLPYLNRKPVFTIPHYPSPPFYCVSSFRSQSLEPDLRLQRRHSTGSEIYDSLGVPFKLGIGFWEDPLQPIGWIQPAVDF